MIAGEEHQLPFLSNNIAVIEVNGKQLSLGRCNDKLFAFSYKCPHAGGILAEGWIDAKANIVCPVHGYRFQLANGRNTSGEGYTLKHWPVECRQDGIFVGMEEGLPGRLP
ncbi:MAG: Rieske 2Fe-2S domain-containing protein [Ferruginibacter sp.]|nr:Rieske 2Fe-2S domain-containing protein [Chitinophagaceae bacterium]